MPEIGSYSKKSIDRAGKCLISETLNESEREASLDLINAWRSSHSKPLQVIKMTLLKRSKKIYKDALIAQRLKRMESISLKLRHNPNMKLSQMQDIGGCRAILKSVREVKQLAAKCIESKGKNPTTRPIWIDRDDYIASPKPDGYRGIHLIYKYQTANPEGGLHNGKRIEIQIRTSLQHAWATAVEVSQTFTRQSLKSKIKTGDRHWLRFFELMGTAIAMRERCPLVPNTPRSRRELSRELNSLIKSKKIVECFTGWSAATENMRARAKKNVVFLLMLDIKLRVLRVKDFSLENLKQAQDEYLALEKESSENPNIQVVLVSVDSIEALRKAYPNYYADTKEFIKAVYLATKY